MRRRYSRLARTEKRKSVKKFIIFSILTISILAALFFAGLPVMIKYTAFITDVKKGGQPVEKDDTTPPPPPNMSTLPESTNIRTLEIEGTTEAGSTVTIIHNNKSKEILANSEGSFTTDVSLKDGVNKIYINAEDGSGNVSKNTNEFLVVFDDNPPELEIMKPEDGSSFYGSRQRQISIEGATEEEASISINERFVIVDSKGSFSFLTTLTEGSNEFIIKATDLAENTTEQSLTVNYSN